MNEEDFINRMVDSIDQLDPKQKRIFAQKVLAAEYVADAILAMIGKPINQRDCLEALIPKLQKELDDLKYNRSGGIDFGVLLRKSEDYREAEVAYQNMRE